MIVLDTSVLAAVLLAEDDAERLLDIATKAKKVRMSAPSLVELGSVMSRRFFFDGIPRMQGLLNVLRIEMAAFDETQARLGIEAYRRFGKGSGSPARLNLGDCFSYALARSLDVPLLFKGDDFTHTDIRSALDAAP